MWTRGLSGAGFQMYPLRNERSSTLKRRPTLVAPDRQAIINLNVCKHTPADHAMYAAFWRKWLA